MNRRKINENIFVLLSMLEFTSAMLVFQYRLSLIQCAAPIGILFLSNKCLKILKKFKKRSKLSLVCSEVLPTLDSDVFSPRTDIYDFDTTLVCDQSTPLKYRAHCNHDVLPTLLSTDNDRFSRREGCFGLICFFSRTVTALVYDT